MGSEIRRVGKSNSVYIISVSERYYFSCAFDCATDSDNVSMIINLQTVPRFVSPPGPCFPSFPHWVFSVSSISGFVDLLAHSFGFARRQSEISKFKLFCAMQERSSKVFKILKQSCLNFKVICFVFYQ